MNQFVYIWVKKRRPEESQKLDDYTRHLEILHDVKSPKGPVVLVF